MLGDYDCTNVSDALKKERCNFLSSTELDHSFGDQWTDLAVPMLISRCNHQAVAIDGRIFVIGGESDGLTLKSGEFYDLKSDQFTYIEAKPIVRHINIHFIALRS